MAFEFTDANFQEAAIVQENPNTDKVVVVDFWAEWCGPCRMITPLIEQLSEEYKGDAIVGKLNVDNNPQIAQKYGVRSIPTILFLKNGEIFDKQVGVTTKKALAAKIDAALAS